LIEIKASNIFSEYQAIERLRRKTVATIIRRYFKTVAFPHHMSAIPRHGFRRVGRRLVDMHAPALVKFKTVQSKRDEQLFKTSFALVKTLVRKTSRLSCMADSAILLRGTPSPLRFLQKVSAFVLEEL
jgi:hypothetical protein